MIISWRELISFDQIKICFFSYFATASDVVFSLTKVVLSYLISDKNELLSAGQYLEQAASTNLLEFLKALSDILVNTNNSSVARTAAGLQLKNHLTSKDDSIGKQYQQRWLSFPTETREYIKNNVCDFYSIFHSTDSS